jgi:hypothetical protein
LVGLQPDIILADGTPITIALQRETRTIPIVFANVSDPVASNIVARLDRTMDLLLSNVILAAHYPLTTRRFLLCFRVLLSITSDRVRRAIALKRCSASSSPAGASCSL